MNGFLSGSIPIYWGDWLAEVNFNPGSFIDATILSQHNVIETIKWYDRDERFFNETQNAPIFTPSQKDLFINNLNNFETVLIEQIKRII
jgi:hypothetical protein